MRLFEKSFKVVIIKAKMHISVQFKPQLNSPDRKKLIQLTRKQSSAVRSAYKLLTNKNSLLVQGAWDRVRSRLVSLEVGGTSRWGIFRTTSYEHAC